MAQALHHAHRHGILHSNLKPANILLDVFGTPYVADLGLGRWLSAWGTPGYMSPEQARADYSLTTAAEIWSLGAILYECLTGKPPYPVDSPPEAVLTVMAREPVPPRQLRPGISRDLEAICLKCLQREPGKRYASAGELADDLTRWVHGEPIEARPPTGWERAGRWLRRRRAGAALAVATMLMALVSVASMLLPGRLAKTAHEQETLKRASEGEGPQASDNTEEWVSTKSLKVALHNQKEAAAAAAAALQRRGEAHASQQQWKEAADDLDHALAIDPGELTVWDQRLLVYLACGQIDDYRKTLAKMVDRFGRSSDQKIVRALVLPCVRIPGAVDELTLLRLAFVGTSPEARTPEERLCLGAALYRANRPAAARQELQAAAKTRTTPDALDSLFTALSLRELGSVDEARAALRLAVKIIDTAEHNKSMTWQQRISAQTLQREAEELVK